MLLLNYFTNSFDKCKFIYKKNKSEFNGFLLGIILVSLIVAKYLNIQKPTNPIERNKIVINISPSELEDSLKVFEPLITKLPMNEFGDIRYENLDTNYIKICKEDINISKILNNSYNNNITVLKDFSEFELKRFLKLIIFLNNNQLSYGIYYKESNSFLFYYRKININNSEWDYDSHRFIYYSPINSLYEHRAFKKLDRKEHLYLLAHSDAHIW